MKNYPRPGAAKFLNLPLSTFDLLVRTSQIKPGNDGTFDEAELLRYKDASKPTVLAVAPPAALAKLPDEHSAETLFGALIQAVQAQQSRPAVPIADKLTLTLAEAAELSGYSRAALSKAIHAGTLKAKKRGGWRIVAAELRRFVEADNA